MRVVSLGSLVTPVTGRAGQGHSLPIYSVTKSAGFVPSLKYFKKQVFSRDTATYKLARKGQFAYATIHLDEGSIGIAPEDAAISPMYTIFDIDREHVHPDYLIRFLKSPLALKEYSRLGKGTIHRRKSISLEALSSLAVPLPSSVEEQRRIAAILDQADALRSKRREVLTHLDALPQSIFESMFGLVDDSIPLGELVTEFRYGTSNKSGHGGLPVLRIPNVIDGSLNLRDLKFVEVSAAERMKLRLQHGDVLLVRSNGNPDNVGRSAAFDEATVQAADLTPDVVYASYLIRVRPDPDRLSGTFLSAYLASAAGRAALRERASTSAGQYNINVAKLASMAVPAVGLAEQKKFARRIATLASARGVAKNGLREAETLFRSLQSRAFKGEL